MKRIFFSLMLLFSFSAYATGVYNSKTIVNNFPLGSCGKQGDTNKKNSELDEHNSPYLMEWVNDSCLKVTLNPENCSSARNVKECEYWKINVGKIVFPIDYSCLSASQKSRLGSGNNMKSVDIGNIYAEDSSGKKLSVGYFRIFRHYKDYQYEMVAYGSRQPFYTKKLRDTYPENTSLAGLNFCFKGPMLEGKTPRLCNTFNNAAKADQLFGELNKTHGAYALYDPASHRYCPTAFALKNI